MLTEQFVSDTLSSPTTQVFLFNDVLISCALSQRDNGNKIICIKCFFVVKSYCVFSQRFTPIYHDLYAKNVTCYLVSEARKRSYFVSIGFVPNSNEVLTKFGFIRACRDRRQKKTRSKWDCSPQETISKILAFTALMMKNASLVFLDLINLWQHSFILPATLRSRR